MSLEPPFRLTVVGRLHGVPWSRLETACRLAGGRAVRRPSARVDIVVLGHGSASDVLADGPAPRLPPGLPAGVRVVSEETARRALGLSAAADGDVRSLSRSDIARTTGLSEVQIDALAFFDVVEPMDGGYRFKDLLAAREAARLLRCGIHLSSVVDAAVRLRRSGRSLADTRLTETAAGDLAQQVGDRLGGLDGQFHLDLGAAATSADEVFANAEAAEAGGDLEAAERIYNRAMAMDRADPTIPFNLGNVLDALGRPSEAALAYRQALARDPDFAEAWQNLAVVAEARGRPDEAERAFAAALAARPGYHDAAYSFALFLMRRGRPSEAAVLWRQILLDGVDPTDAKAARRFLALCRDAGTTPASEPVPASAPS
ncbi:MAG TPA: tetratricopeptide repeat protein [Methylomirabilota bacterium]|nr:tetratricopeptide repeat protein [Methylomirabilota bacterium]